MRVDITGRNVDVTPPLRQLIDKRLARLGRLLNDSVLSAQVILTREKYRHRAEIVVHARGDHMMRGLGEGNAWPISLRQASGKLEQQAQKLKSKWDQGKRRGAGQRTVPPQPPAEPTNNRRVVRATRYGVKPMSVEDAALQVESGTESFIVFRNAETEAVSILYRRRDGNFGLIEPD